MRGVRAQAGYREGFPQRKEMAVVIEHGYICETGERSKYVQKDGSQISHCKRNVFINRDREKMKINPVVLDWN